MMTDESIAPRPRSYLVTGGSGYFGSLLLEKLRPLHARRSFDLVDDPGRPPGVEFIQGDIRDYDAIASACRGVDVIHHNVAGIPLSKDPDFIETVNLQGTDNLLRAAREAGVKKVIYTSSSAIYGIADTNPIVEDTPANPGELYGRAKAGAEAICRRYAAEGLDVTVIRPRTIMGYGRLGIFQILFEWVRTGYNVPVLDRGDNIYQFVHADDLADACIRAGERPGPTTYNIGADGYGTMREVLEALCRHAGTGSKVVGVPMAPALLGMKLTSAVRMSPLAPYHILVYGHSLYFDVTKAKSELGWEPKYSNDEMFIHSYEWYLANRERVLAMTGGSHNRTAIKQGILNLVKHLI